MNHRSLQKIIHLLYFLLGIPVILGIIYVVGSLFFSLPNYFSWSKVHLFFVILLEPLLTVILLDKWIHLKQKDKKPNPWVFILIFFVINSIALFVFFQYYSHPERAQYDSVKILLKITPFLWVIAIISNLFCIVKVFREKITRVWKNFSFSRTTILDQLSTKSTALILIGFFILGLTLRLINLDQYPPYVDEYIHTHTAFGVMSGLPMTWNRAFLSVTVPVLLSYKLFGITLWAARFPMVVFNMLAIFPLYFLGKKVNKTVGFISVFLFTLNPWIIAASRTVREYAVIPLYFFLSCSIPFGST